MSTPDPAAVPAIDPFAESMAEAVQTSAAAFRLMMTISDAVRRAAQRQRQGTEEELAEPEEKLAPGWAADALRPLLDDRVLADLMAGQDWPAMAGQMVGLQKAGVDLTTFLPQLGQAAKTVFQAVEANQARITAAGTDRWADLLQKTMPEGLVRDAILASPAWPDMAAKMALLDRQGVDVAGFLKAAHDQGVGVDRAVAALLTQQVAAPQVAAAAPQVAVAVPAARPAPAAAPAPASAAPGPAPAPNPYAAPAAPQAAAPAPAAPGPAPAQAPVLEPVAVSADARAMWGPLTEGLSVPNDLDLSDRSAALEQLGVGTAANSRLVNIARDYIGSERETALLVSTRAWPLLAARMAGIARGPEGEQGLRGRLKAGLMDDGAWGQGPPGELAGRMVGATLRALTTPPGAPIPDSPRASATAARSRSTTTPGAAPGQTTPTEPAVPAHRQVAAPAKGSGRRR
ncbi:hypothetical protein CP980_34970 [Streptomyces vinaceus]|uniref:Antibiotic production activating factor n=1 Tax=Streptomyces vinaceus TaxID=1960 RepID=A0A5J6JF43_STRVI|nr:hypothetical protein [Streptomyces vinaceus]QEV49530.1 hypothetical protein CP980_34970 [Streptomyces vinaceus]GHE46465.1 hypothetical protein GCM10017778_32990 [Streptomyces vinaceus]